MPAADGTDACPSGWTRIDDVAEIVACVPWASIEEGLCELGSARFPGEAACAPIGSPCPAGDFADAPAGATAVYVRPGAAAGDGTRERPFSRIADALARAPAGATIMLAKGRYDEAVEIARDVSFVGACAAETEWIATSPGLGAYAVVLVTRGTVSIRDVRIADAPVAGVWVEGASATVALESVRIERTTQSGLVSTIGAHLNATRVAVVDTRPRADGFGRGLSVEDGAEAVLDHVLLERNHDSGASGFGGHLVMRDSVVRDSMPSAGFGARGLEASTASTARLERTVIERTHGAGVMANDGSSLELDRVVVRDTSAGADDAGRAVVANGSTLVVTASVIERQVQVGIGAFFPGAMLDVQRTLVRASERDLDAPTPEEAEAGIGIVVEAGAIGAISQSIVESTATHGFLAGDEGTRVTMSDVIVRRVRGDREVGYGRAVEVARGAELIATRVLAEGNRDIAVYVTAQTGGATRATFEDVVVVGTEPNLFDGTTGRGIVVAAGATARIARAHLEANHEMGLGIGGPGPTAVELEDIVVRDTRENPFTGELGMGATLSEGAQVTMRRALFEWNRDGAIYVDGAGTALDAEDLRITETYAPSAITDGQALVAQHGATVSVRRALFERSRGRGIVFAAEAVGSLSSVRVLDVLPPMCPPEGCAVGDGAFGVMSYLGARLDMSDFEVRRSDFCGVLVAWDGVLTLHRGIVADNHIGACVQVEGYDLSQLTDEVRFEGNQLGIESTTVVLPEPRDIPFGGGT